MKKILFILFLFLSTSVNASIINTLNGTTYEWLELTETQGLSRNEVDLRLLDPDDVLFSYQYASRSQVNDLFNSYAFWGGNNDNGWHGEESVVQGVGSLITDFGATYSSVGSGIDQGWGTVDGYPAYHDGTQSFFYGLYGSPDTCAAERSCLAFVDAFYNSTGSIAMVYLWGTYGWDPYVNPHYQWIDEPNLHTGSFLLREVSAVPLPAAVWLFGSGLVGLIGLAKRKTKS